MKSVLLGMSGGVDSSAAAYLLQKDGYVVTGATMLLWDGEKCGSKKSIEDAKIICDKLGIEHITLDFRKEFKEKIIDNFAKEYLRGWTPNPCILCNKFMKFGMLFEEADKRNIDYVSTGHYAIVENDGTNYILKKSNAGKKDQTYVLYNLKQEQLKRLIFPLGKFETKDEIRDIAKNIGIDIASKPDSQDICFVPDNDYAEFIKKYTNIKPQKGNFVDVDGNVLGIHEGIINYTVGQRKWLGIALGKRTYVLDINVEKNEVILGEDCDTFKNELIAKDVNWIINIDDKLDKTYTAKIRYGTRFAECKLEKLENGNVKVKFLDTVRAVTKGQAAVFYDGDIVIGGGTII